MGLTIHYEIQTPADWTPKTIGAKLEEVRQFAKTLPVLAVSDLVEFQGQEADFQFIRDSGREKQDKFFWAKIQAERFLTNPWQPGNSISRPPQRMIVFSVDVAEGCEQMNLGSCWFGRHVWKAQRNERSVPSWSLAFDPRYPCHDSEKMIRAFLRRWRLKKLVDSKPGASEQHRFGGTEKAIFQAGEWMARATIQRGRYLSHRKGYAGQFGLVTIRDHQKYELYFRFAGTAEEAERVFRSTEFQVDLTRMACGQDHVTPAAGGLWSSFCKTQYANDPRCGGWPNFAKAHLSVLAILEQMQTLGFAVEVRDEGDFWESRDLTALGKSVGQYDAALAGLFGAMKDAAGKEGMDLQSGMAGRPDFEQLEMKGLKNLGEWVKRLNPPPNAPK